MYIRKRHDKGAESPPRKNEYETVSNHPILKTDWALRAHIPRFLQTRPDRKQEFCDQRFYIDRGNEAQQEFPCNVSGESGVNSVKMFAFRLCKNGMETKQGMRLRLRRGFFICGHSPRILARASRRASTVCQPRKSRYLPPVNGHFRSLAWSAALLLCPARTDIGCTPVSSLHFSLPCPHSTHGTRIPGSGISIFAPGTSRTASGCFFLSATP